MSLPGKLGPCRNPKCLHQPCGLWTPAGGQDENLTLLALSCVCGCYGIQHYVHVEVRFLHCERANILTKRVSSTQENPATKDRPHRHNNRPGGSTNAGGPSPSFTRFSFVGPAFI